MHHFRILLAVFMLMVFHLHSNAGGFLGTHEGVLAGWIFLTDNPCHVTATPAEEGYQVRINASEVDVSVDFIADASLQIKSAVDLKKSEIIETKYSFKTEQDVVLVTGNLVFKKGILKSASISHKYPFSYPFALKTWQTCGNLKKALKAP